MFYHLKASQAPLEVSRPLFNNSCSVCAFLCSHFQDLRNVSYKLCPSCSDVAASLWRWQLTCRCKDIATRFRAWNMSLMIYGEPGSSYNTAIPSSTSTLYSFIHASLEIRLSKQWGGRRVLKLPADARFVPGSMVYPVLSIFLHPLSRLLLSRLTRLNKIGGSIF